MKQRTKLPKPTVYFLFYSKRKTRWERRSGKLIKMYGIKDEIYIGIKGFNYIYGLVDNKDYFGISKIECLDEARKRNKDLIDIINSVWYNKL